MVGNFRPSDDRRRSYDYRGRNWERGRGRHDRDRNLHEPRTRSESRSPPPRAYYDERDPRSARRSSFEKPSSTAGRNDVNSDKSSSQNLSLRPSTVPKPTTVASHKSRDLEVKRISDIASRKTFYWLKRDELDKKQKTAQSEIEKTLGRHVEFASIRETFDTQLKAIETEKNRLDEKVNESDQEFVAAVLALLDQLSPSSLRSDISQSISSEIDGRLTKFKKELVQSQTDKIVVETKKLKNELAEKHGNETKELERQLEDELRQRKVENIAKEEMNKKYVRENQELKQGLELEREKRQRLEDRFESLEKRLNGMADNDTKSNSNFDAELNSLRETVKAHEQTIRDLQAQRLQFQKMQEDQLNETTKRQYALTAALKNDVRLVTQEVEKAKTEMMQHRDVTNKQNTQIGSLDAAISSLKISQKDNDVLQTRTEVQSLKREVDSSKEAIKLQEKQVVQLQSTISTLPVDELKKLALNCANLGEKAPVSNEAILKLESKINRAKDEVKASLQQDLYKATERLGKFIDEDRKSRSKSQGLAEEEMSGFRKEVESMKSISAQALSDIDDRVREKMSVIDEEVKKLDQCVQSLVGELHRGFEDHQLQIAVLNTWANNFSSKELFKSITDHMNASITHLVRMQVQGIIERINALEVLRYEGASKRRKVPNGSAVAVNGNH